MRRRVGILAVAALVCPALASNLFSQAKLDARSGLYRVEGSVTAIDREKSVFKLKEASSANVTWTIAYSPDTAYTAHNKDAKFGDIVVGAQVICLGKYDDPKNARTRMTALRIDLRRK